MLSQPAVDPIISRLRPRSVQEIIDQAFRLYRRHFLTFVAITAVVFVPVNMVVQLISVMLQGESVALQRNATSSDFGDSSDALNQYLITSIVLIIILVGLGIIGGLMQYLSQGALTSAVAGTYLDKPVSFGGAYRNMLRHVGPLVGAIVLQILIGIGIFLPIIALFLLSIGALAAGGDTGFGAGFGLLCAGFLLMLVAFFVYAYVFIRLQVIVPALMVESLGPVEAVRRSWQLVQNYWWRTFALFMVLYLIELVISAGLAGLVTALAGFGTQSFDPVLIQAISGAITVIVTAFFIPLQLVSWTLYYFDLRVRKEGFDIETAASQRYSGMEVPRLAPGTPGYSTQQGQYGQYGQYASPGGYPPPTLGYTTQPQGQYPGYTPPVYQSQVAWQEQYGQPAPAALGSTLEGSPTLPSLSGSGATQPERPAETPRVEGLGFSTPSIAEQAAQVPSPGDAGDSSGLSYRAAPDTGPLGDSAPGDGSAPARPGQG